MTDWVRGVLAQYGQDVTVNGNNHFVGCLLYKY